MLEEAELGAAKWLLASSGWTSVVAIISGYLGQGQQQAGSDYTAIKELFCTSVWWCYKNWVALYLLTEVWSIPKDSNTSFWEKTSRCNHYIPLLYRWALRKNWTKCRAKPASTKEFKIEDIQCDGCSVSKKQVGKHKFIPSFSWGGSQAYWHYLG